MVPPYSNKISRVPSYLFVCLVPHNVFCIPGYHRLWPSFPTCSTILYAKSYKALPTSLAATMGISVDFFSYRYLDVSVPYVRLFTLLQRYLTSVRWVPPFGHLRIKVLLPTPRSFSQAHTSFIASNCQGIHRLRLFT